ncbi:hypothetical protein F5876DRAFT_67551 [Lentinula aff. lateritia]|uniref:Uncharacterized protein n=1 Tax=Lentinula aff. lateritia TaxID=2804960 RepID=A0ACC1TTS1_9AGAR|nr:hypothetical protein F5876DRAFT_67551 [Lentinula aff. lateritia]
MKRSAIRKDAEKVQKIDERDLNTLLFFSSLQMESHRSSEQPFDDLYLYSDQPFMSSSYESFGPTHPSLQTSHSLTVDNFHHDSTSQQHTRHFIFHFLKEDDERFFATFPEAAKAAAQQQQQQWLVLGRDYRDFNGSAAFNLSANHGTYAYPSPTSPVHPSNVVDVMEGGQGTYPAPYATSASSSHASFPYTVDPNSCNDVPLEGYNQLSESAPARQGVVTPVSNFANSSFYPPLSSEVHPNIHGLQHDSIMPLSLPSPISAHASGQSPQLLRLESPTMNFLRSPSEMTETLFSPIDSHHPQMYSLSPEAILAHSSASPSPTLLPRLPSTLSPVSMVTPTEQLTLPPVPQDPQSDSEPLADDSSGASSSKTVLTKPSVRRKRRRNLSEELQSSNSSKSGSTRSYVYGKIPLPKPTPPPAPKASKSRPAASSSSSQSEKKSLALACFFCRGRKIACGPQDPNSADLRISYGKSTRDAQEKVSGAQLELSCRQRVSVSCTKVGYFQHIVKL